MIPRILEPEVMDTAAEALDYNSMDHSQVNRLFVDNLLAAIEKRTRDTALKAVERQKTVLDVGTGTALIPIELCGRAGSWQVTAVDLAAEMLTVAKRNIAAAGFNDRVTLRRVDAKRLPFAGGEFEFVISNSIVHHIPEPQQCLAEMIRIASPGGLLFVRDLLRPATLPELEQLVTTYAGDANAHQQQMFRASLHAALTLDEARAVIAAHGVPADCVQQTSDRHWTLAWNRQSAAQEPRTK